VQATTTKFNANTPSANGKPLVKNVGAFAFAIAVLSGCGGGGGSEPAATATTTSLSATTSTTSINAAVQTAPVDTSAVIAAVAPATSFKALDAGIPGCQAPDSKLQFSAQNGFSFAQQDQETEFTELLNYLRCLAALPALTRADTLDVAAQKHADYAIANGTVSHDQISGKVGFSGAAPGIRMGNAGYATVGASNQPAAWGEVVSKTGSSARESFEGLTAAIYHRFVMLSPQFNQVGVGLKQATGTTDMLTVADYAATTAIKSDRVIAFPAADQINVPTSFNSDYETPDPIAGASFVGYPVSVQADRGTQLQVTSFTIRKAGETVNLDAYVRGLGAEADAHMESHTAFLATKAILQGGTKYEVNFVGTSSKDGVSKNVNLTWTFTTAGQQELAIAETTTPAVNQFIRVKLNGCGSTYKWQYTSGLEVTVYSSQWMQIKPVRTGAQWVEITDSCGAVKRVEFTVK
jgi:uncharacterized protein YkwD